MATPVLTPLGWTVNVQPGKEQVLYFAWFLVHFGVCSSSFTHEETLAVTGNNQAVEELLGKKIEQTDWGWQITLGVLSFPGLVVRIIDYHEENYGGQADNMWPFSANDVPLSAEAIEMFFVALGYTVQLDPVSDGSIDIYIPDLFINGTFKLNICPEQL